MKTLGVSFLVFSCAACVPFYVETYYHPEAPTGIVARSTYCGAGPSNRIQFTVGDIGVSLVAYRTDQALRVSLSFSIPESKTVILRSRVVHIRMPATSSEFRAEFIQATLGGEYPPPREPADRPMIGGTKVFKREGVLPPPPPRPVFYVLETTANVPDAEILMIKLPPFEINGTPFELPEVALTRKKHVGFLETINC